MLYRGLLHFLFPPPLLTLPYRMNAAEACFVLAARNYADRGAAVSVLAIFENPFVHLIAIPLWLFPLPLSETRKWVNIYMLVTG